jgi:hypothetical protein
MILHEHFHIGTFDTSGAPIWLRQDLPPGWSENTQIQSSW